MERAIALFCVVPIAMLALYALWIAESISPRFADWLAARYDEIWK